MVVRKRTTTKVGQFGKRTRTVSSTGRVTESFSSKPPGKNTTRRTVSHSGGKIRTTYSTKLGGGYTKVTTKTKTLTSKPRAAKPLKLNWFGGKSKRQQCQEEYEEGGTWSWTAFFLLVPLLPIILPFKWFGVWGGWIVMFIYYYMIFE